MLLLSITFLLIVFLPSFWAESCPETAAEKLKCSGRKHLSASQACQVISPLISETPGRIFCPSWKSLSKISSPPDTTGAEML